MDGGKLTPKKYKERIKKELNDDIYLLNPLTNRWIRSTSDLGKLLYFIVYQDKKGQVDCEHLDFRKGDNGKPPKPKIDAYYIPNSEVRKMNNDQLDLYTNGITDEYRARKILKKKKNSTSNKILLEYYKYKKLWDKYKNYFINLKRIPTRIRYELRDEYHGYSWDYNKYPLELIQYH